jgi:hypothetical protein
MFSKKIFICLVSISLYGCASGEKILVSAEKGHRCSGDIFPVDSPSITLFPERSCELPLANANRMKSYVLKSNGTSTYGCWERKSGGNFLIVTAQGEEYTHRILDYVDATLITPKTAKVTFSLFQATWGKEECPKPVGFNAWVP